MPGQLDEIVLRSDAGTPSNHVPFSVGVHGQDLVAGQGYCGQILV